MNIHINKCDICFLLLNSFLVIGKGIQILWKFFPVKGEVNLFGVALGAGLIFIGATLIDIVICRNVH